ncbi:MAG: glutaminase [Gammaproteobacteria bacterium]|jgi:glutaminase
MSVDLIEAVQRAYQAGCAVRDKGRVANYIPELAKADPTHFGIVVSPLRAPPSFIGDVDVDVDVRFTLQSVFKAFSLAVLAQS